MAEQAKRFNQVVTLIGDRGTGKTTFLKKLIPLYVNRGMKVLIIDTLDHPAYRHIQIITPNQLKAFRGGVCRMIIKPTLFKETMAIVNQDVWNALVVIEDAYKYMKLRMIPEIEEYILDTKQKNVDLFFMYHTWDMVVKSLLIITDAIQLFKTEDHPKYRKNAIAGCYNRVEAAYNKIQASNNPFETISIEK